MRTMPTTAAWLVSITLMAGVAATSWYLGDQAAVTVAKIAIVPLYLLATKGLRAYFQNSSLEDADLKAFARFQFSDAALLAAFVVIVAAHADSAAGRMVMDFIWIAALTGGTLTVAIWLRQRRQNSAK
ncbi:hypothetical protein [Agrobacterium cavarae]|uniref:hypothetical protein n=1 Tax=Agrobacterium cavarae TaxID=2528239 RepID=UPI003FD62656